MPVSYGQVKGRKYTAIQPIHDPENPKPTRYPKKVYGSRPRECVAEVRKEPIEKEDGTTGQEE